ncbi:hypothetical protein R1sor_006799 [Riccia sorocarpa]|uniref:Uncharacterized protein n=1 Tax=Riccia sorocarpa TaxID=122646 RepID=A0ABD3HP24_9MARC
MGKINERDSPPDRTKSPTRTSSSALLDEEKSEAKEEVAEVPIPWRTSRRLQEATLKSLQERDSSRVRASGTLVVKKEKEISSSTSSDSSRPVKRQHHSPSTEANTGVNESEKEICENKSNSVLPLPPSCINSGRKRRRKVHFANPLSVNIEDEKQINPAVPDFRTTGTSASTSDVILGSVKKSSPRSSSLSGNIDGMQLQPQPQARPQKLPLSCFDLLCNHLGPKGWRCYRVRLIGESYCSYHKSPATSTHTYLSVLDFY